MKITILIFLLLATLLPTVSAQQLSFKDTVAAFNLQRIHTNKKGMVVLTSWGAACLAGGIAGYVTAPEGQAKYFYEMTAIWGAINTGIGITGLADARKEMHGQLSYKQAYNKYLATKRLYLLNAAADLLYIGIGVGFDVYGENGSAHDAMVFKGLGNALIVQGVFLLAFDNVMYASHMSRNSKWFQVMDEIRISGHGVGWVHPF